MMRRWGRGLGWVLLLGVLASGCRTFSSGVVREVGEPIAEGEAETSAAGSGSRPLLLPADALPETFVLRQTVTVRWAGEGGQIEEAAFDAAVQRQGESLLLLGLGPMGGVGFILSLEQGEVSFENRTGRDLPFAPERMLADVQRVYYPWLAGTPECDDCIRRGQRGGFEIEEQREHGWITRRRFVPLEEPPGIAGSGGGIEVLYSGEPAFGGLLRNARLRHEKFGYELELETLRIDWID